MSMMMLILMVLVVLMVLRAASARGGCPNSELVVLRGKSKVAQVDGSRGARRNPKSPQMAPPQHSQMPFCAPRAKNHAITLHRIGEMHYKETCKPWLNQNKIGKHILLAKKSGPFGSSEQ